MRLVLTLLTVLFTTTLITAQCPEPGNIQVLETQRSALVSFARPASSVDSVQIIVGDEFFTDVNRDPFDTIYTFTADISNRTYILYDLEPDRYYRAYVRFFCGPAGPVTSRGELFRTQAEGPPENDNNGLTDAYILAAGYVDCGYYPATTRDATSSLESQCGGAADDDVWFSLVYRYSEYRVTFRPVAGTDQDLVVEVFDGQLNHLDCIDTGGSGATEHVTITGLTEGEERYIRVYTKGATGYADFEYCNYGIPALPVAAGTGCISAPPITFDGGGSPGEYTDVLDEQGAVIVSIENTQSLGEVNVSFYGHDGGLRTAGTGDNRYAGRNISIVPATQPTDTVGVRLYLSAKDINELIAAGAISSVGELNVTKVPEAVCSLLYPGGGEAVAFRGAGTYGDGYYVDIGVAGFSEFYVHPWAEPLVTTTAMVENRREAQPWGVGPNPLIDYLVLTPPAQLRTEIVNIEVFDALGRRVLDTKLEPATRYTLNAQTWKAGAYVLVLTAMGKRTSVRLVK